jgi:hypothetical protein
LTGCQALGHYNIHPHSIILLEKIIHWPRLNPEVEFLIPAKVLGKLANVVKSKRDGILESKKRGI